MFGCSRLEAGRTDRTIIKETHNEEVAQIWDGVLVVYSFIWVAVAPIGYEIGRAHV